MSDSTETAIDAEVETRPGTTTSEDSVVTPGGDTDITAENYAQLIRSAGLTREDVATPEGHATDAIKVVICLTPFMVKVNDAWVLCCPDFKYAQFLAVDQNWLDVLTELETLEVEEEDNDA
jgi:hypothetical protein